MSDGNSLPTRRTALKSVGATMFGSLATGIVGGAVAAQSDSDSTDGVDYATLRGTEDDPITSEEIESLRADLASFGEESTAIVDPESTFADDQIIGYNVVVDESGKPREQYVARASSSGSTGENEKHSSDQVRKHGDRPVAESVGSPDADARLHEKADAYVEAGVAEERKRSRISKTASGDWEIDWDEWYTLGRTDVYWEPDEKDSYRAKVGNVEFKHEVVRSPDYDRAGARSKIRMEPGRQICNDGLDDYCTTSIQDGYSNKGATVHHDWDQPVNPTDTDDLIVNTDPEGQVSDVTGSRGYSLGLDIAREPSLSVGFSSSVSFPGAQLIDATTKSTGRSEHKFRVNSSDSPSASNTAVFEVASLAGYEKPCTTSPPLYQRNVLDIDVDMEWGLNPPIMNWAHTESKTKSFAYTTWC